MTKTLVVYHDNIPKHKGRANNQASQSIDYDIELNGHQLKLVTVKNWHRPYGFSKKIKTLTDFASNSITADVSQFASLDLIDYDKYIFVCPMDFPESFDIDPASLLFPLLSHTLNVNHDAKVAVTRFNGFDAELNAKPTTTVGAILTQQAPISSEVALKHLAEMYLSYRMTDGLSEALGSRIGLTPTQFKIMSIIVQTPGIDVPDYSSRISFSDGNSLIVENVGAETVYGFAHVTSFVLGGNKLVRSESRIEALKEIENIISNISANSLKITSPYIQYPPVSEIGPAQLLVANIRAHGPAYVDRMTYLAATGFVSNPFSIRSEDSIDAVNVDAGKTIYNMVAANTVEEGRRGVCCDIRRGPSELLEKNDKLVTTYIDIFERTLCSLDSARYKGNEFKIDDKHGSCKVIDINALRESYLMMQGVRKYSYFQTGTPFELEKVSTDFQIKSTKLVDEIAFFGLNLSSVAKELSRLLSKKYVRYSQGGGLHLTDFGVVVFRAASIMYSQALSKLDNLSPEVHEHALNNWFQSYVSETSVKKLPKKFFLRESKAAGKKRKFTLVIRNTRGKHQCYWKSGTYMRGVKATPHDAVPKIGVMPNSSLRIQTAKHLDNFIKCSCGCSHATYMFDKKTKTPHWQCSACKATYDHYVNL